MLDYQYTYLMMGVIFSIIWLSLFYWRKDSRHQMVVISLITGFLGPIAEILYLKDWWSPQFIFGPHLNVEAFTVGFMIGGIGTTIYEAIFHKRVVNIRRSKKQIEKDFISLGFLIVLGIAIYFGVFAWFNLNSFHSTILALLVPTLIMWQKRTDLVMPSLITGLFLVMAAMVVYSILDMITPGWVHEFWHFSNVPRIIFMNVPIDDIVWYFVTGLFIGPLYEYWHEARFRRLPKAR